MLGLSYLAPMGETDTSGIDVGVEQDRTAVRIGDVGHPLSVAGLVGGFVEDGRP